MTIPRDRADACSFRHELRQRTRAAHDASETLFARFTDAPADTLGWFLAAQRAAIAALQQGAAAGPQASQALTAALLARLDSDLDTLGRSARPIAIAAPIDPLAVDYLVLGSRLGTEVLRRRLMACDPPMPLPSYFLTCPAPGLWRRHCAVLETIVPGSARAGQLTRDVIVGYGLFRDAAQAQPA